MCVESVRGGRGSACFGGWVGFALGVEDFSWCSSGERSMRSLVVVAGDEPIQVGLEFWERECVAEEFGWSLGRSSARGHNPFDGARLRAVASMGQVMDDSLVSPLVDVRLPVVHVNSEAEAVGAVAGPDDNENYRFWRSPARITAPPTPDTRTSRSSGATSRRWRWTRSG